MKLKNFTEPEAQVAAMTGYPFNEDIAAEILGVDPDDMEVELKRGGITLYAETSKDRRSIMVFLNDSDAQQRRERDDSYSNEICWIGRMRICITRNA